MKKIKGVLKKYKNNEIAAWTIQKIDYELNPEKDRCVTIIPLSSIKEGKVHPKYEIDLGGVKGIGNEDRVRTKALPKQIKTIDKIRIDYNKKVMARLSNEQLDAIDEKLKELFIKKK